MTSTWRRVIRLAVEWSRERVGIWSKTAWSGQGCAGCRPERKRCWTYEPPTSTASGMPSGTSTSRRRMNGFTAKYGRLGEVNPVVTPKSPHAKACLLPSGLSSRENLANHFRGQADDGRHSHCWCGLPRGGGLAYHQLEVSLPHRVPAPGPYREGDPRRPMGQGESLAISADSLVQWQGPGHSTGDRKPRQRDSRCGPGDLGHPGEESDGLTGAATEGLQSPTVKARVHT